MNEYNWKAKWRGELEELLSSPGVTNLLPDEVQERILEEQADQQWQCELDYRNKASQGMKYLDLEDYESCVVSVLERHPTVSYEYETYPNGARKYTFSKGGNPLGYVFLNPSGKITGSWKISSSLRLESKSFLEKIQREVHDRSVFMLKAHGDKPITNDTAVLGQAGVVGEEKRKVGKKVKKRANIFKKIKDINPQLSYQGVATRANRDHEEQLGENVTEDTVRNTYRAMSWIWKRADKIR